MKFFLSLIGFALLACAAAWAEPGEQLFVERCSICHQVNGLGVPPVYPPLAESDFLQGNRTAAIKGICEGLSGKIQVKGVGYDNVMPAQMLDDSQVAALLSYILRSWGNRGEPVTPQEVTAARAQTKFPTYADLVKAGAYAHLPAAPKGWSVREVCQLPEFFTRMAGDREHAFLLAQSGTVYLLDVAQGAASPIIRNLDYLPPGDVVTMGMTLGPDGRLWIVSNERLKDKTPYLNEVVIYRTAPMGSGLPGKPEPWLKTSYPYGIGPYNHGVSHLAFGPDGMLYVNSGARTDGGEAGADPKYYQGGEVDLTACIWRIDPKAEHPKIEVYARGIRNAYGFAWDSAGHFFSIANGPDASAPEEMDYVLEGHHYGFPYQFSNWPPRARFPYSHTPVAPEGLKFDLPVSNLGPDGGGTPEGLSTLDPHSSPAGMIWCGEEFPEPLHNSFLVTRFGNLLGPPAAPVDVGFDLLSLKMEKRADATWATRATKILGPLGRPVDVLRTPGKNSVLVLEYTRPLNFKDKLGWLPGRVLELAPAP